MSFLIAQPEILAVAADELHTINAAVGSGSSAAVVPAAADVVSLLTAAQFASHARLFHEISAEAAAVRAQLATTLGVSAGSYAATETANITAVG